MAQIGFSLKIRDFSGEVYTKLHKIYNGKAFSYNLFGSPIFFSSSLSCEEHIISRDSYEKKYEDIEVVFTGEIPAEIDIDSNSIYYYNGPKALSPKDISAEKLRHFFKYVPLDDEFEGELEIFCQKMTYAIVLTAPDIRLNRAFFVISLDQIEYKRKGYIDNLIQEEIYQKWPELFQEKLDISQVWNWLICNGVQSTGESISPLIPTMSYLFNRDYHEVLLYSMIGLESLYCSKKNSRGVSYTLQNRITAVFPSVSMEQIKNLYSARSEIAHGKGEIGPYDLIQYLLHNKEKYVEDAILSSALFIESIRKLIANNAKQFSFQEKLDVQFDYI